MTAAKSTGTGGIVRVSSTRIATDVNETWRRIGSFADAGRFLNVDSVLQTGEGGLGSIRRVGEAVVEKMVAQGTHFYVYVQTAGPLAHTGYHGCLSVEADGPGHSVIVYSLVYDEDGLDLAMRNSQHEGLTKRFQGAVDAMRELLEA